MLRILTLFLTGSLASLAFMTYGMEHDTRAQQRRIVEIEKAIAKERDAIAILRAEWSHLNRPQRLEKLARKHLGLRTLDAQQIVSLKDLDVPSRSAAEDTNSERAPAQSVRALGQPAVVRR